MCFSIPSKITALNPEGQLATVDTLGRERHVSVHLIGEPLAIGDYLLIQSGFAMEKISEERALDSLALYREIVDKMTNGEI
ncbi:HypC/HybG/HupF family hydrogenase formation chaperone [Ferrimonas gelatinilytica]|uniref:HypC/HybG/HupF family hydrogenase formation chaperone n=1 Tax=Ferrimonas gelatinilytica TaxID=1255257 RepID=A0ABP9S2Z3_9GAMM